MSTQCVQVVADSGIFIASVLKEPYSKQADGLISLWDKQHCQIVAPTLLRYEVTAVIRKNVYRGNLTPSDAAKVRANLQTLITGITFMIDDQLFQRGYELAERFNLPTAYDSQYLALTERLGCEFWTADERLFNRLTHDLNWIKWIGHFSEPPTA